VQVNSVLLETIVREGTSDGAPPSLSDRSDSGGIAVRRIDAKASSSIKEHLLCLFDHIAAE
jgi:hypothetical protein